MPKWFANAKKRLAGTAPEEPEPFSLRCSCEQTTTGLRLPREQAIQCSGCGSVLFILPKNVYPEPPPRRKPNNKTKSSSAKSKETVTADAGAVDTDNVEQSAPIRKTRESKREERARRLEEAKKAKDAPKSKQTSTGSSLDTIQQTLEANKKSLAVESASPRLKRWSVRSLFTGFRAVILGVTIVTTATIYWQWRSHQIEQAELNLGSAIDSGEKALAEYDFITADVEFQRVAQYLSVLGRTDPQSRSLSQIAQELHIVEKGLCNSPLIDMLNEAVVVRSARLREAKANEERAKKDLKKKENEAEAEDDNSLRFSPLYISQWIVFDVGIEANRISDEKNRISFEYPLPINGKPVVIYVSPEKFQVSQLSKEDDDSARVILAAQLKEFREKEDRWIVELNHESAFLWTNSKTCIGLGLLSEDPEEAAGMQEILVRQAEQMGVSYEQ